MFFILCIALAYVTGMNAQTPAVGDVTLELADGSTVRGYCRTNMVNQVIFFELIPEPKGERIHYKNDQIARIVFDGGAVYIKKDYIYTV